MASTVSISPEFINWAIDRSGVDLSDLERKFPRLTDWREGRSDPTIRQLEEFAKRTLTPFGYFFLPEPPTEELTIPDFRTVGDTPLDRPSPNLLAIIYDMRRRQQWMKEYLAEEGHDELSFVGSVTRRNGIRTTADSIREELGLDSNWSEKCPSWEAALIKLREGIEKSGVLISTSGIVGLNTRRKLDTQEFRGFVICDPHAPLIFVNGADSKSAQMFTLAHELAHLWLGKDGIFNLLQMMPSNDEIEIYCNKVAAEFLVPAKKLIERWQAIESTSEPFKIIARWFKVSPIVVARRTLDLNLIDNKEYFEFYNNYQTEWRKFMATKKKTSSGGNFYATQNVRLGQRFSYAVIRATQEGRLLYRDAYKLTGLRGATFTKFARRLLGEN